MGICIRKSNKLIIKSEFVYCFTPPNLIYKYLGGFTVKTVVLTLCKNGNTMATNPTNYLLFHNLIHLHRYCGCCLLILVYSMECYVCHNQEGNRDKCVKTSMQCLQNEDTCMTNISYTGELLFMTFFCGVTFA